MAPEQKGDADTDGRHAIDQPDSERGGEPSHWLNRPARPVEQLATFVQPLDGLGIKQRRRPEAATSTDCRSENGPSWRECVCLRSLLADPDSYQAPWSSATPPTLFDWGRLTNDWNC